MAAKPPASWPKLRQELSLAKGPVSAHGAPCYTLHDPVSHRFFRLGWLEMEIIRRWALADAAAIASTISAETTLSPTAEEVENVLAFMRNNGLCLAEGPADSARLCSLAEKRKIGPFMFLVKNYLFLRLPLFKPDLFLSRTLFLVKPFFTRRALFLISALALLSLILIARNYSFFRHDLETLFSVQGAVMVLAAMGLSKVVHELGHAYAAKLLGLRVPSIGLAFMCFYPMLWTDTTEAWKCVRRQDRLLIGLSGVGAELALAALASLAWLWLPPGLLREMALTLAGVTWLTTLAINANPFMRYDAYYILSDLFEMPMLQSRSFALAKWFMRKKILGLEREIPEPVSPKGLFWLVAYAYSVWIYRFFLFLGIAFLVYHMFFKLLGLALFLVEIIWFLTWPVVKELREWWRVRAEARPTFWGFLAAALLVALFIPWRSAVVAPAVLEAEKTFTFHAPAGALVASEPPAPGSRVEAGQLLLRLSAPDLDFDLKAKAILRRSLELQTANAGLAPELWFGYASQKEELAGVLAEEKTLESRREGLDFLAPFSGEVREIAPDLSPGQWVGAKEPLMLLTGGQSLLEAWVPEEDVLRLKPGGSGLFIPGSGGAGPFELTIVSISPGTVSELSKPSLASVKGGPLPVRQGPAGQLWPERAVYLVRCRVENLKEPPAAVTGLANLKGERQSLALRAWRFAYAVLIGESGLY